ERLRAATANQVLNEGRAARVDVERVRDQEISLAPIGCLDEVNRRVIAGVCTGVDRPAVDRLYVIAAEAEPGLRAAQCVLFQCEVKAVAVSLRFTQDFRNIQCHSPKADTEYRIAATESPMTAPPLPAMISPDSAGLEL